MTTAMLTLDYEKKSKSEMGKLIAEVSVESIFQLIGIIATFFMASRREYKKKENDNKRTDADRDENEMIENGDQEDFGQAFGKQRASVARPHFNLPRDLGSVSMETIR